MNALCARRKLGKNSQDQPSQLIQRVTVFERLDMSSHSVIPAYLFWTMISSMLALTLPPEPPENRHRHEPQRHLHQVAGAPRTCAKAIKTATTVTKAVKPKIHQLDEGRSNLSLFIFRHLSSPMRATNFRPLSGKTATLGRSSPPDVLLRKGCCPKVTLSRQVPSATTIAAR